MHFFYKYLVLVVLVGSPIFGKSQPSPCNLTIPPFISNGVEVSHFLGVNTSVPNFFGLNGLCDATSWGNATVDPVVYLGEFDTLEILWNPFVYKLLFSKPVNSLNFIITGSGTGILSIDDGAENFVFETEQANLTLQSLYACHERIENDTIFIGDSLSDGSGLFSITFDCPVYEFTISGKGGGSGSGFKICSNSLTTPYLWGRVSGDSLACAQDSVLVEAFGGVAPYTFSYTINGGATQTLQSSTAHTWLPTPSAPGTYTYKLLQVQDGADSTAIIACNSEHTVIVKPKPTAQFSFTPTAGEVPFTAQASNTSQNATNYAWFLNNTPLTISCPSGSTCPISLVDTGSYTLQLVAYNNEGCTDTASTTITGLEQMHIIVPNVFTPNNDGINDQFGITTTADASVELVIVNRWGNVVLEKAFSTKSNTFIDVWNGASATDGTYFFKLKVSPLGSIREVREVSGFVNVIR